MSLYVPEPRDKSDTAICKEIESRNWKGALKLIDKRLGKEKMIKILAKDKTAWLEALKCFIQCNHPSYSERTKGMQYIMHLGTTDFKGQGADVLELLDEAAEIVIVGRQARSVPDPVCQARSGAVKANPKDEKLALASLRACMKANDLEAALEILPVLERNFSEKRQYSFWSITISCLYATSISFTDVGGGINKAKKELFLKIAYSKLKAFATATQTAAKDNKPLPLKSLQNSQELLLLYRVSEKFDLQQFLAESLVLDPAVGYRSPVGKNEWILALEAIKFCTLKQDWEKLFDISSSLLSEARANNEDGVLKDPRGADWQVWKAFMACAKHRKGGFADVKTEINKHLHEESGINSTYFRNASLASLHALLSMPLETLRQVLIFRLPNPSDPSRSSDPERLRISELFMFLNEYKSAASTFGDIKPYVEMLSDRERALFHNSRILEVDALLTDKLSIDEGEPGTSIPLLIKKMTTRLTDLKVKYLFSSIEEFSRHKAFQITRNEGMKCVTCNGTCSLFCRNCLENHVKACLVYYIRHTRFNRRVKESLLPTDRHPADGFAILATMSLVKLAMNAKVKLALSRKSKANMLGPEMDAWACSEYNQRLLQAAVILQYAHQKSKPNPDITLLLQQIYYLLGAGSLAMETYQELNLKQIQNHTLGYVLFDRIATLHPKPCPSGSFTHQTAVDPAYDLKKMQQFYRKSKVHSNNNMWTALEYGSYDTVFQLTEFGHVLSSTRTAALSIVESRRVARLLDPAFDLSPDSHGFDLIPEKINEAAFSASGDTFDYKSFPNFEHTDHIPFRQFIQPGSSLKPQRIVGYLFAERLHELLASSFTGDQDMYSRCLDRLREDYKSDRASRNNLRPSAVTEELSVPEYHFITLVSILVEIVLACVDSDPLFDVIEIQDRVKDAVESLNQLVKIAGVEDKAKDLPLFATTLHPIYVLQETELLLAAVDKFLTQKDMSLLKDSAAKGIEAMSIVAKSAQGKAQKGAKAAKDRMGRPGRLDDILGMITDGKIDLGKGEYDRFGKIGDLILNLVGADALEAWASSLVESYHDSVDGLEKVCKPVV